MGLRPTGRCPECGTRVVESLYFAANRRERSDEARSRWNFEKEILLSEWRLASGLGMLGAVLVLSWFARAGWGGGSFAQAPSTAALACVSGLAMFVGLRITERLGVAGFPSRRAMAGLTALLHLFAIGVVLAIGARSTSGAITLALPAVAAAPLGVVLRSNAPEPWMAAQIVLYAQAVACGVLFIVRFAL